MEDKKKHPGGRPLKFKTVQELEKKVEDYFKNTLEVDWSVTGLALHLDTTRDVLIDYEEKDEYSYIIKKAKLKIELGYEKRGNEKGRPFDIFRLKNMGWKDERKQELNHSGSISLTQLLEAADND